MYIPPLFKLDELGAIHEAIRAARLASLVTATSEGLIATPLPMILDESEGEYGTLYGHVAKPNPHWRYLQARPQALVTFLGPHAYMSPTVYPDLQRVPTWNYLAVHCRVQARLIEDAAGKDTLLKKLIGGIKPPGA